MLFSTLAPSSLPVVVGQPEERHANRAASVLKWYDRQSIVQHLAQTKKNYIENHIFQHSFKVCVTSGELSLILCLIRSI